MNPTACTGWRSGGELPIICSVRVVTNPSILDLGRTGERCLIALPIVERNFIELVSWIGLHANFTNSA
jgi:hypothetical protein